jgi:hypothetical protein
MDGIVDREILLRCRGGLYVSPVPIWNMTNASLRLASLTCFCVACINVFRIRMIHLERPNLSSGIEVGLMTGAYDWSLVHIGKHYTPDSLQRVSVVASSSSARYLTSPSSNECWSVGVSRNLLLAAHYPEEAVGGQYLALSTLRCTCIALILNCQDRMRLDQAYQSVSSVYQLHPDRRVGIPIRRYRVARCPCKLQANVMRE